MSMKSLSFSLLLSVTVSTSAWAQESSVIKAKEFQAPKQSVPLAQETIIPPPVKEDKLKLKVGISGTSKEDPYLNTKYAGGSFTLSGEKAFTPYLSGRLGIFFLLATGNFSNRYSTEGKAPNLTTLDEAVLELRPTDYLAFQAGVIATDFSAFTSTFDSNGFPGVKESLILKGDYFQSTLFAMQTVPVSGTPSVKTAESGVTSTFQAYGLDFGTNAQEKDALTMKASVARFEFKNLTSSAAVDSVDGGNMTLPGGGDQVRFRYAFGGYEGALAADYKFNEQYKIKIGGSMIRNDQAPEGRNKGYVYSAALTNPLFKGAWTTTLGYFYNESDTLPSAYVTSSRGYNNRFGQFVYFKHELEKDKITSFLKYTRVNEIEDRPLTADRDQISVGLEVEYEIL